MPEEAAYSLDQAGGATETEAPNPPDACPNVGQKQRSFETLDYDRAEAPKPDVRPEIREAIARCLDAGSKVRDALRIGRDAETSGYIPFLDEAVPLFHEMTEEERECFIQPRNVRPSPENRPTNKYYRFLKALFSADEDDHSQFRTKVSEWAKLCRGMIEGCDVKPEPGEIKRFLLQKQGRKKGRSLAVDAYNRLPDVIEARKGAAAKRDETKAARRENTLEKPHARPDPEKALSALSSLGPDDLSFVSPDEAVVSGAPLIEFLSRRERLLVEWNGRRVPVDHFDVVPTEDGSVIVLHVPEDDERLAELSEEQAS